MHTTYQRHSASVDIDQALAVFNVPHPDGDRHKCCVDEFRAHLDGLNKTTLAQMAGWMDEAQQALLGHVHYERVDKDGHRVEGYSDHDPLFPKYFTEVDKHHSQTLQLSSLEADIASMDDPAVNKHIIACNGWMTGHGAGNFADASQSVYMRRGLFVWGDCVKLRFGERPEDCPYLWQHMTEYMQLSAKTFHALRLDNCHGTPVHVGEVSRMPSVNPPILDYSVPARQGAAGAPGAVRCRGAVHGERRAGQRVRQPPGHHVTLSRGAEAA